jgi:hypothetical protein
MFWSVKPTISEDDVEWQLAAWEWLLDNLGGLSALKAFPSRYPRHADFPKSGLSGHEHVAFMLTYLCGLLGLDVLAYELRRQSEAIDPHLGHLAIVENAPQDPGGTYRTDGNRQVITYHPAIVHDLEQLIAVLVHELCHSILFAIPTRPLDWAENEEFVTDLAVAFFGFGVFGGNQSFQFSQFRDDASGTQGWSTRRLGYLTQNEWGFALALRAALTGDDMAPLQKYASGGLLANVARNRRYLEKNRDRIDQLIRE